MIVLCLLHTACFPPRECKVPKDRNLISLIPCCLSSTQNRIWHMVDTQPTSESINESINSPGRGASMMEWKKREIHTSWQVNRELLLSELWPMEPHSTADLAPCSNGKEVKQLPNQDHKVGDLEAMALWFSKNRHEAPFTDRKSRLWTNGCNPEDPQDWQQT